ncbi:YdcF family protein [Candidatus Saccharibacteria bacterium]|nr:YdcF family protein [Candidatus Saccharibacteria bacterium]
MRESNTQLPSSDELWQILAMESPRRTVEFDYIEHNTWMFDVYREVADDASWVEDYARLSLEEFVAMRDATTEELVSKIMGGKLSRSQLDMLYRNLAGQGNGTSGQHAMPRADAAFVFGSPSDVRVNLAVECYFRNATTKLILSGKGPYYRELHETEADRMKRVAMKAGVPERAIIVENQSVTLPDNVKRTLDLFYEMNWHPRDLIVIATTVIKARAYMEWYKFTPWDIEIHMLSPKPSDSDMTEDGWFRTERGVRIVLNEYAKIVGEHKMDLEHNDARA